MAPCAQLPERSTSLGNALSDGRHTVGVEATDTAGNVARVDRAVAVDRNAPGLSFVPSSGGRRIAVDAVDPGTGVTGGTIEARRRGQRSVPSPAHEPAREPARTPGSRAGRARPRRCA